MAKVFEHEGHWLWTGQSSIISGGRTFELVFRNAPAQRYAWTSCRGPLPRAANLKRACDQLFCVNPWHFRAPRLEPAEPSRAFGDRDACSAGHKYEGDSYYIREQMGARGNVIEFRECRQCNRERAKEYYRENTEACKERVRRYQQRIAAEKKKDSCASGHKYTEGSYRLREKVSVKGRVFHVRVCRHCEARRNRTRREKRAGK